MSKKDKTVVVKDLSKLGEAMLPKVEANWGKDTLELALMHLQEMPEVTLMAQLEAVEEQVTKKNKEILRTEKDLGEEKQKASSFQAALLRMEAGFKNALTADPEITKKRERWGDFFNSMIELLLEDAKKSDKQYKKISADLRKTMKNAQAMEAAIEASRRVANEYEKTHGELETQLTALLGQGE